MKNFLILLLLSVISFTAHGQGDAPPMYQGMDQASKSIGVVAKLPYGQVTKLSSSQVLLETGNTNYLPNAGFEASVLTGWNTYVDATGVAPVDGTGGTADSTFTDSTVSPLRGEKSGLFSKPVGDQQGEGFSTDFKIDPADRTKLVGISFDYETSPNYKDGDIRIYVYDKTNARLIELIDRDLMANATGTYSSYFQASPDSVDYRLIGHIASVNSLAYTVKLDEVKIAPKAPAVRGQIIIQQGSVLASATPFSNATITGALQSQNGSGLYTYDSSTGVYTVLKKASFDLSMTIASSTTVAIAAQITGNKNGTNFVSNAHTLDATGHWSSASLEIMLNAGDNFQFKNATGSNSANQRVYVSATHVSDNVVLSEDAGNREVVTNVTLTSTQSIPHSVNTKVTSFTTSSDSTSSWDATNHRYVVPETGRYDGVVSIRFGAAPSSDLRRTTIIIYKNGAIWKFGDTGILPASVGGFTPQVNIVGETLAKGEYLEIYVFQENNSASSVSLNSSPSQSYFSIAKRSSPQTIAASETVAVRATQSSGQSIPAATGTTVIFNNKVEDTHNAYNASTGIFTAPVAGRYLVTSTIRFDDYAWAVGNVIGFNIIAPSPQSKEVFVGVETTTIIKRDASITHLVDLKKGDSIYLQIWHNRTAGSAALQASATYNTLSIIREGN